MERRYRSLHDARANRRRCSWRHGPHGRSARRYWHLRHGLLLRLETQREQGIRIALGAQRYQVIRSTLSRPIVILLSGSCVGLVGGLLVARLVAHLVSFPSTSDPFVLFCVVLTMMLLGLASTWIPARRALAIDPARLLRE